MTAHLHDFQEDTDSQEEKGGKSQKQVGPWSPAFALPLFRQAQLIIVELIFGLFLHKHMFIDPLVLEAWWSEYGQQ